MAGRAAKGRNSTGLPTGPTNENPTQWRFNIDTLSARTRHGAGPCHAVAEDASGPPEIRRLKYHVGILGARGLRDARASCARSADVECQRASPFASASCARATEVESQQAPPLTSIMCESSRCRDTSLLTSNTNESGSGRRRVRQSPLLTSNVCESSTSTDEHHERSGRCQVPAAASGHPAQPDRPQGQPAAARGRLPCRFVVPGATSATAATVHSRRAA
jgi:hypothetical protein